MGKRRVTEPRPRPRPGSSPEQDRTMYGLLGHTNVLPSFLTALCFEFVMKQSMHSIWIATGSGTPNGGGTGHVNAKSPPTKTDSQLCLR